MFQVVSGRLSVRLIRTTDLIDLKPYFQGTTSRIGAPFGFGTYGSRSLAVGGTALAFTWFADGVKRLGAARASAFVNLVPVFAVLQAAILLDERLGLSVLGGGLLVIAGVWMTTHFSEKAA